MPSEKRKIKETFKVRIISNEEINKNVFVLECERTGEFIPGQIVAVGMNPYDNLRLYSIASGKDENLFRLLFDINPDGGLTPVLAKLKSGDYIFVSKPFGRFTDQGGKAMWIATGTGIAPFISMMKSGLGSDKFLLHGARFLNQFYYGNEFEIAMKERYLRFCTQETAPGINSGRLTSYLKNCNQIPVDIKYYICGSSQMVVDVRDILIDKGVPFDQIIAEIYF